MATRQGDQVLTGAGAADRPQQRGRGACREGGRHSWGSGARGFNEGQGFHEGGGYGYGRPFFPGPGFNTGFGPYPPAFVAYSIWDPGSGPGMWTATRGERRRIFLATFFRRYCS